MSTRRTANASSIDVDGADGADDATATELVVAENDLAAELVVAETEGTATIHVRKAIYEQFIRTLHTAHDTLGANYTCLKLIFEERYEEDSSTRQLPREYQRQQPQPILPHLTRLEVAFQPGTRKSRLPFLLSQLHPNSFPNLKELFASALLDLRDLEMFCRICPTITLVSLKRCASGSDTVSLPDIPVQQLILDDYNFGSEEVLELHSGHHQEMLQEAETLHESRSRIGTLKRFTMTNASWTVKFCDHTIRIPVTKAMLLQLVYLQQWSLQYVCSDVLTVDSMATFQQVRPGVKFEIAKVDDADHSLQAARSAASPFDGLNVDCLFKILSFLHFDDMNSFATCSKHCRDTRRIEKLDQTRTATLIASTLLSSDRHDRFFAALRSANSRLNLNYKNFKIVHLQCHQQPYHQQPWIRPTTELHTPPFLQQVTRLDITCAFCSSTNNDTRRALENLVAHRAIGYALENFVAHRLAIGYASGCFPNLQELHVSDSRVPVGFQLVCDKRPSLTKVSLTRCSVYFKSRLYFPLTLRVSEVILNDVLFQVDKDIDDLELGRQERERFRRGIERLTMTNVMWTDSRYPHRRPQPVTQELLLKVVRFHQSLRYVRSDLLTADNLATFQRARPEATFVIA